MIILYNFYWRYSFLGQTGLVAKLKSYIMEKSDIGYMSCQIIHTIIYKGSSLVRYRAGKSGAWVQIPPRSWVFVLRLRSSISCSQQMALDTRSKYNVQDLRGNRIFLNLKDAYVLSLVLTCRHVARFGSLDGVQTNGSTWPTSV